MILAQDEARQFGSKEILPEHVLLAMLRLKEGVGFSSVAAIRSDVQIIVVSHNPSDGPVQKASAAAPLRAIFPVIHHHDCFTRIASYGAQFLQVGNCEVRTAGRRSQIKIIRIRHAGRKTVVLNGFFNSFFRANQQRENDREISPIFWY